MPCSLALSEHAPPPCARARSGDEDADTTSLLDLDLGLLGEVASLHDDRLLRQLALARDLHVARLQDIDHGRLVRLTLVVQAHLLRNQGPQPLHVDDWDHLRMLDKVEVSHTHLAKVSRVVLVEINTVVVLTTRIAATAWMLAVLADAPPPIGDLTAEVTALLEAGRHRGKGDLTRDR